MVKLIRFWLFLCLSLGALAADQDKVIENTLSNLEVVNFVESVQKLKSLQSLNKISEFQYQLKPYQKHMKLWNEFDEERYSLELKYLIKKGFKREDLKSINKQLQNPFILKVIKRLSIGRDIFSFIGNLKETDSRIVNVKNDQLMLYAQLYKFHSYNIQNQQIKSLLKPYTEVDRMIKEKNKSSDKMISISPILMEKRLKETRLYFLHYMALDLKGIRDFEIREYMRVVEKDPMFKQFITFFVNYHFTYLRSFYEKV